MNVAELVDELQKLNRPTAPVRFREMEPPADGLNATEVLVDADCLTWEGNCVVIESP